MTTCSYYCDNGRYGVLSRSGWGDGCYACLVKAVPVAGSDKLEVVAAKIVYVSGKEAE